MNNILEYKGYHTRVEFDSDDFLLRGKIEGINDLVNFECGNIKSLEKEFHEAVDDYLNFCKEVGKDPDKEYKGTFNVRIDPVLHKKLAIIAIKNGDTLNATVEKAIQAYVSEGHDIKAKPPNTIIILASALKTKTSYQYNKDNEEISLWGSSAFCQANNVKMKYSEEMRS